MTARAPWTAWAVALCALVAAVAHAQDADSEAEWKRLSAELVERRAVLSDLDNQQRSLVDGMGELDESIAALDDAQQRAQRKHDALDAELAALAKRAAPDQEELRTARARLQARLRTLYVNGEGEAARALLGAEGFEELALRRRFLAELAARDRALVQSVAQIEARVRAQQERLKQGQLEAALVQREIGEQRALIDATRAERQAALLRIDSERTLSRRRTDELVKRRDALTALVGRLVEEERARKERAEFQAPVRATGILKRGLPWPVEGGVVLRRFGVIVDARSRAEEVSNGMDIRAEAGAPVQAVADGRVVHTGWLRGFGRMVIVDHGDGHHTLMAHLQSATVQKGDVVKRGQTIGFVGDTESENGPKLYFELRVNGRPHDPAPFLRR